MDGDLIMVTDIHLITHTIPTDTEDITEHLITDGAMLHTAAPVEILIQTTTDTDRALIIAEYQECKAIATPEMLELQEQ